MSILSIVILVAGVGKRMQSFPPRVLLRLIGETLLSYVLTTAKMLLPGKVGIVVGHGGDLVKQSFSDHDYIWVTQSWPRAIPIIVIVEQKMLQKSGFQFKKSIPE